MDMLHFLYIDQLMDIRVISTFFAILVAAAVNIHGHISVWTYVSFWIYRPKS